MRGRGRGQGQPGRGQGRGGGGGGGGGRLGRSEIGNCRVSEILSFNSLKFVAEKSYRVN